MRGILKVGRDFFVYFDSKIGLVRRMERNDAYKMLRLCDCMLIDAIKLKKFIDSIHDFLEIPYEGDLDADVICDQDDLSKFTVACVDAIFRTDDDCDDRDDIPQTLDQTDTEILLPLEAWEAEEYGDQEIEELEKDDSSPLWDEDNLFGGGVW